MTEADRLLKQYFTLGRILATMREVHAEMEGWFADGNVSREHQKMLGDASDAVLSAIVKVGSSRQAIMASLPAAQGAAVEVAE